MEFGMLADPDNNETLSPESTNNKLKGRMNITIAPCIVYPLVGVRVGCWILPDSPKIKKCANSLKHDICIKDVNSRYSRPDLWL